ncbi:N-acetylmuramoyl-L-alanine amidase [Streptomyces sp. PA03-6a]|nr:N-acetylmuramoyl-L-alanine amidase [Streptomyces sp. PA03-6a]
MAWYPGAKKMELQPESDSQQAIRPTQLICHSIAGPWTAKRTYEYWRDSTNLESHFGLGYSGDLGQYIGTETRADANASANRRADGTGAVSVETASNVNASDPWTDEQVEELIKLGVWMHTTHGMPLRLCRTPSDPGVGYHKQFAEWNPDGHACPGPARIKQLKEVVLPGMIARAAGQTPEEDDMPLSADDLKKAGEAAWKADVITAAAPPYNNSDYDTNKQWTAGYALSSAVLTSRKIEAKVDALTKKVDGLAVGGVDLDALAAKVADLLSARLAK